jgi:Ca-activated chloride channel family protein
MLQTAQAAPAGLVTVDGETFPLRETSLRTRAAGGIAATTLIQVYDNPHREPLEVLYTMPLPADGAVIGYTIELGERRIVGEIEKRKTAREKYLRALEEGRTAGLLEQERADTFTQTLGNLPPGETARIEIEVLQPLQFRAGIPGTPGEWEFRFPTVVGVRYQSREGRVPDRDRLDAPRADQVGTPARLDLDLLITDGGQDEIAPNSSTHELFLESGDAGTRLSLKDRARLDRDVVIRWRATGRDVGLRLREGRGLEGDVGRYGLLTITPPTTPAETFARDLTLVIDASGSMTGEPIRSAKSIAASLLQSLGPADRFELLAFSMEVEELVDGPVEATPENIRAALGRLETLTAGGGTEMVQAITGALEPLRPDSQRQVVLLTDGYIGFEGEVVGNVMRLLPDGARLHTVGIGSAPNRALTRYAARAGRGVELAVSDRDEVKAACERLRRATAGPVLTDLRIEGSVIRSRATVRLHDVLAGQPVVIPVELKKAGGMLQVTGRLAGASRAWTQEIEIKPAAPPVDENQNTRNRDDQLPLGPLFGREIIDDREMLLAAEPDRHRAGKIETEIEALGMMHRITSRRTSLVAVSEDPTVDPLDPRRRRRLETELPAGVSAEGVGLPTPGSMQVFEEQILRSVLGVRTLDEGVPADETMESLSLDLSREDFRPQAFPSSRGPGRFWYWLRSAFRRSLPVARVVRSDEDMLVVEFEAPGHRLELPSPGEKIDIVRMDGSSLAAVVVPDKSTRPGAHPKGTTLRLAMHFAEGVSIPSGDVILGWGRDGEQAPKLIVRLI